MREIKFRAWHTGKKVMFSPEEMELDELTILPATGRFINVSGTDTRLSIIADHDTMIPMQYTGLHDCKGAEIYEGDIVRHSKQSSVVGEVKYYEGAFVVGECLTDFAMIEFNAPKYLEVIGNIHQHPDLIRKD